MGWSHILALDTGKDSETVVSEDIEIPPDELLDMDEAELVPEENISGSYSNSETDLIHPQDNNKQVAHQEFSTMTFEELGKTKVIDGKHIGKTLADVWEINQGWFTFVENRAASK